MSHNAKVDGCCSSCGNKWVDHLGPQGLCAELRRAREEIARLRLRLKEFEQERFNHKKGGRIRYGYK